MNIQEFYNNIAANIRVALDSNIALPMITGALDMAKFSLLMDALTGKVTQEEKPNETPPPTV